MNRLIIIGCILFLVNACSSNRDKAQQHLPIREKYAASALQEDFQQVLRVMRKNHPALYDFISKEDFERLIEQQYEKINDSLTITDFFHVILPVVNGIGCGHTTAWLPERVWLDSSASVFPLHVFFQNNRAYVFHNYSPYDKLTVGAEILSINGAAIPSLIQSIGECVATDGTNISAKIERLNQSFGHLLATYNGIPNEYEIELRTSSDSVEILTLPSLDARRYFEAQLKSDSALLFEMDSARSTAVITIRSFGFYENNDEFKAFVDRSFNQIQEAKIDHVILDLRNNSGGDPFCASYLLSYLLDKPIAYFSQPYAKYTQLAKVNLPSMNQFSGKLYTLINGACFSTTGHLCALLKHHKRGEFIGSETGGTFTCNDNSQIFRLINTGILVSVARTTFSVAVEGIPRFTGIIPDYAVESSVHDLLTGKDRLKEFARARIEASIK